MYENLQSAVVTSSAGVVLGAEIENKSSLDCSVIRFNKMCSETPLQYFPRGDRTPDFVTCRSDAPFDPLLLRATSANIYYKYICDLFLACILECVRNSTIILYVTNLVRKCDVGTNKASLKSTRNSSTGMPVNQHTSDTLAFQRTAPGRKTLHCRCIRC